MSRLTRLSLANRTVVILVTLLTIGMGLYAARVLKQELIPNIDIPRASVVAIYPGASPETVERDVTKPLETAVKAVSGVTGVMSTTSSGMSQMRVEWDFGEDGKRIQNDLRTAVDSVTTLPTDVNPQVITGGFDDIPVAVYALGGEEDQDALNRRVTDSLLPELRKLSGVRDASVSGGTKKEVIVTLNQPKVRAAGVDETMLAQMFTANAMSLPAGTIRTGAANLDVQVGTSFASVADIKSMRVQGTDGPVALGSIADVREVPVATTSISRVNGKPSLTLAVTKERDANTVTVAQEVRAVMDRMPTLVGAGTTYDVVFDQSPFIEQSVHDLAVEGGLGLVMAVLVILLFLRSVRPTLITAISIPLSLFIALVGLWTGGYTLNLLTLGALTVAIGRVVDDSIVVIENIQRHQQMGDVGMGATVRAVKEVAGAVTASTLTTVAVFLPIGLVGGQAGQMFRPFAVTVTISLLASLLVSLTVIPVLASWFMAVRRERAGRVRRTAAETEALAEAPTGGSSGEPNGESTTERAEVSEAELAQVALPDDEHAGKVTWLQKAYLPVLDFALRRRIVTLVVAVLVFGGTLALVPRLKTDFIGDAGQTTLALTQKLPPGTSLAQTDVAAKKLEAIVAGEPTVETYSTTVGGGAMTLMAARVDTNTSNMNVTLKAKTQGTDVAESLRSKIKATKGLGTVDIAVGGGGGGQSVVVYVEGADAKTLASANTDVLAMMKSVSGLSDVKSDLGDARQMLDVKVDGAKAAAVGMTQAQVGQAVTRAVHGQKIGTMTSGDTTLDVLLRSRSPVRDAATLATVPLPVTQKQTMDVRKAAADKVTAQQEDMQARQKADQTTAYREQLQALRDSRAEAQDNLGEILANIAKLEKVLRTPLPRPTGPPAAPDPLAQVRAQLVQLRASADGVRKQITALDDQMDKAIEGREKALDASSEAEAISDAAKNAQEATAAPVQLKSVATVKAVNAPASITRVDGQRTVTITASPTGTDLGSVTRDVQSGIAGLDLPPGATVRLGGVSVQQQESFAQLGLAMLIATAIVYLIMVGTFGSLVQPLILLVSIPFAATGAIGLSLLTDTPLGVPSMIGLLMLIGIVVTNAIVLIDLINQYRERGDGIEQAIVHGARLRLRPIIMTALATICALIPMGLGVTGGGVFISKPLAIVVIGGLVSSTLLTLILVPVLYDIVERLKARRAARNAAAPPELVAD